MYTVCKGCTSYREDRTFHCSVSCLKDTSNRPWCNAMSPKSKAWKRMNSLGRRATALYNTGLTRPKEARFNQICREFDKLAKEVCP